MTVTTDRKQLFSVTIRRTYTAKHRAQWSDLPEYSDSSHPEWGESAEAVVERWATIHDNVQPYWLEKFRDEVLMVEPLDADKRRAEAAELIQRVGYPDRCCDLAIVNPCVCAISYTCPDHGTKCHGTHD
jgi:hypothetical protein